MATKGEVKALTLATSKARVVINLGEGIAYDPMKKKIYVSFMGRIWRANDDGNCVEEIYDSSAYGSLHGLYLDSSTGNLYAGTYMGSIIMLRTAMTPPSCVKILTCPNAYTIKSLILNSQTPKLYFSTHGGISRVGLDGSNLEEIYKSSTGSSPRGIALDAVNSNIYWTDYGKQTIMSSDLDGRHVRALMELPRDSGPYGIAYRNGRVYFATTMRGRNLQSCDINGQDVCVHFTGKDDLFLIALGHLAEGV